MELLCQRQADLSLVDNVGATALHYAANHHEDTPTSSASSSALKHVLSAGVDPDLRDEDGRTPLMWAATAGNYTPGNHRATAQCMGVTLRPQQCAVSNAFPCTLNRAALTRSRREQLPASSCTVQ